MGRSYLRLITFYFSEINQKLLFLRIFSIILKLIWKQILCLNLPSASTSFIMSWSSASVGFWPSDRMTVPNSLVVIVPSPSLSNNEKASLNSAICSSVNWSAWKIGNRYRLLISYWVEISFIYTGFCTSHYITAS